jgi:hypothetical protein
MTLLQQREWLAKRINPVTFESSIPGQPRSPCDHKRAGGFTPPGQRQLSDIHRNPPGLVSGGRRARDIGGKLRRLGV